MNKYAQRDVVLATKHQKENAIRFPFESELKCHIHVPFQYDTDQFGTFTREIPRKLSPYETLIEKAKVAANQYGYKYAISNEGSFGSHPQIPFVPCDTELMAFIDIDSDLVVTEIEISTATNYSYFDVTIKDDYEDFLTKIKFPSHGVIISTPYESPPFFKKDIRQFSQLEATIKEAFKRSEIVRLETDMRAMMNPSRMEVIKMLAIKLVKRIQQECPNCNMPGFGKVSTEGFLTCEICGADTELYRQKVLSCVKCDYKTYEPRDDGLVYAQQQYCFFCNP